MDASKRDAIRQARKDQDLRKHAERILRDLGTPEIAWILDCSGVEQSIWCDFWTGQFPEETEESLKWCLGLPASERDAQLGIMRRLATSKKAPIRVAGHPEAFAEAFPATDDPRSLHLVTLARLSEKKLAEVYKRYRARKEARKAAKPVGPLPNLPGNGFSNTEFGRVCARLAREITRR